LIDIDIWLVLSNTANLFNPKSTAVSDNCIPVRSKDLLAIKKDMLPLIGNYTSLKRYRLLSFESL
jgi:hypothetical protein